MVDRLHPPVTKEEMDHLADKVGSRVIVLFVKSGTGIEGFAGGVIDQVDPFSNMELRTPLSGKIGIPFAGDDKAIKEVVTAKGEVLFQNHHVDQTYNVRDDKSRHAFMLQAFGPDVADEMKVRSARSEAELRELIQ